MKNFECPDYAQSSPTATFPEISNGLFSYTKNARTKFEVRSFTHSWDNRGTQNLFSQNFNGLMLGWTL